MRTREPLKSPVRDIRTPGSGRGPLDNRRSYRDGGYAKSMKVLGWILFIVGLLLLVTWFGTRSKSIRE